MDTHHNQTCNIQTHIHHIYSSDIHRYIHTYSIQTRTPQMHVLAHTHVSHIIYIHIQIHTHHNYTHTRCIYIIYTYFTHVCTDIRKQKSTSHVCTDAYTHHNWLLTYAYKTHTYLHHMYAQINVHKQKITSHVCTDTYILTGYVHTQTSTSHMNTDTHTTDTQVHYT